MNSFLIDDSWNQGCENNVIFHDLRKKKKTKLIFIFRATYLTEWWKWAKEQKTEREQLKLIKTNDN